MSFWHSELGELSGTAEAAFIKTFGVIPDGTMAIAKIEKFNESSFEDKKYYNIDWLLTDGEYKGQHVFQKIKVYDEKPTTRHQAKNMLMLIYKMFGVTPASNTPPTDQELRVFIGKFAGIKIQETPMNDKGRQYNYVSEVHPKDGFKSVSGIPKPVSTVVHGNPLESALTRQRKAAAEGVNDDVPW